MTDEAPMPNTPEARTETGELRDASQTTTTSTETPSEAAPAAPTGAPETYADFKAPEGQTLDKATIEAALPIFKELGLSQDAAQKLVDFHAAQSAKTNADLTKAVDDMRAGWRDAVMKDPEIGPKLEIGRAHV